MAKSTPVYDGCKPCGQCRTVRPLSQFLKRGRGYSGSCRFCLGEPVTPPGHKKCSRCKCVKPVSDFYEHGVRRGRMEFKAACKACLSDAGKERYAEDAEYRDMLATRKAKRYRENADGIAAAAKLARQSRTAEQVERERQKKHDRYIANRNKVYESNARWRAENREKHRATARTGAARRRAANPEPFRESGRRAISIRRARLRGLPREPYTLVELLERDGDDCVLCGEPLDLAAAYPDERAPTREHLECLSWPDATAGDVPSNVAVSHWGCNNERRNKPHPAAARKRAELLAAEAQPV